MESLYYTVAGHTFQIICADKEQIISYLPSYSKFYESEEKENLLFQLVIDEEPTVYGEEINRFEWDGSECIIYRGEEGYTFVLSPFNTELVYKMRTNAEFSKVSIGLKGGDQVDSFVLNNFLMMTYAFASASERTLMIHASVIRNNGKGYLFLGKSGTGKSTHTRLWLKHVEGSDLLNDDNPIIRIIDGVASVYGSPWSGKTPCYRNLNVPVGAFVKLKQAPGNNISLLNPLQGFAEILSSCSLMKWDERIYNEISDCISAIIKSGVSVYALDCLPDREAALLSSGTIQK